MEAKFTLIAMTMMAFISIAFGAPAPVDEFDREGRFFGFGGLHGAGVFHPGFGGFHPGFVGGFHQGFGGGFHQGFGGGFHQGPGFHPGFGGFQPGLGFGGLHHPGFF